MDNENENNGKRILANIANYATKAATGIDVKKGLTIIKILVISFITAMLFLVIIVSNLYELIFSSLGFYDAEDYVEQFSGVEISNLESGLQSTYGSDVNAEIDKTIQDLLDKQKSKVEKKNKKKQEQFNGKGQYSESPEEKLKAMDQDGNVEIYINDFEEDNVNTNYNKENFWGRKEYTSLFSHITHNYSSEQTVQALKQCKSTSDYSHKATTTADIISAINSSTDKVYTTEETDYTVTNYEIRDNNGTPMGWYTPSNLNWSDSNEGMSARAEYAKKINDLEKDKNNAEKAYKEETKKKIPSKKKLAELQNAINVATTAYEEEVEKQKVNPYGVDVQVIEKRDVIYEVSLKMYEDEKDLSPGAEYKNSITEEDIGIAEDENGKDGYAIEILKEIDAGENGEHGGWGTTVKILAKVTWHKVIKTISGWIDKVQNALENAEGTLKESFGASTRDNLGGFKDKMKEFDATYSYRTFIKYEDATFSTYGASDEDGFYSMLRKAGYTHEGACGLMGNLFVESSFNPTAGSTGGHYGLVQWGDARLKKLMALQNYDTLEVQINYMFAELNGSGEYDAENDSATGAVLKQSGMSVEQCCYYVMAYYERCPKKGEAGSNPITVGDKSILRNKWQGESNRVAAAKDYDTKYKNFDYNHYEFSGGSLSSVKIADIMKEIKVSNQAPEYKAIEFALQQVGKAYSQTNRNGPNSYDCSSLCYHSYLRANISMQCNGLTNTKGLWDWATENNKFVDYSKRKPGDVFLYTTGGRNGVHHASLYVGTVKGKEMLVNATDEQHGIEFLENYQWKGNTIYVFRPTK